MNSIASDKKTDFININKWGDMPCSWLIILGIVKTLYPQIE